MFLQNSYFSLYNHHPEEFHAAKYSIKFIVSSLLFFWVYWFCKTIFFWKEGFVRHLIADQGTLHIRIYTLMNDIKLLSLFDIKHIKGNCLFLLINALGGIIYCNSVFLYSRGCVASFTTFFYICSFIYVTNFLVQNLFNRLFVWLLDL